MATQRNQQAVDRARKQPRKGGKFVKVQNPDSHASAVDRAINPQLTEGQELPVKQDLKPWQAGHDIRQITREYGSNNSFNWLREDGWFSDSLPPVTLSMPLTLKWGPFTIFRATVYGGSYLKAPLTLDGEKVVGVKMAAEIYRQCDIDIPTVDFQVPARQTFRHGLFQAMDALLDDKPLYVGCMGGIGRTGLFMAGLAKLFGLNAQHPGDVRHTPTSGPVGYVRTHYRPNALETEDQIKFIKELDVTGYARHLRKLAFRRWVRRGFKA